MDRNLTPQPQWSQFFSQLPLPTEWAELYSRSFTDNSMQLEMIPDLQADLMNYLGINKLGHFLMIKKRAKELLSHLSHNDSPPTPSGYPLQVNGYTGSQSSLYSQPLHSSYFPLQPYQIRNNASSLSPPLTNTPPNLIPSLTMDLESLNSFRSDLSARCHVERRRDPTTPTQPPNVTHPPTQFSIPQHYQTSSTRIPPTSQTPVHQIIDLMQVETQPDALPIHSSTSTRMQDPDTNQPLTDLRLSPQPTRPLALSSLSPPHTLHLFTSSNTRNLTPSPDGEIDVQPYTETVFTLPNKTKAPINKKTGRNQTRPTKPTVATQGSVQKKKRNASKQKTSVKSVSTRQDTSNSTIDPSQSKQPSTHITHETSHLTSSLPTSQPPNDVIITNNHALTNATSDNTDVIESKATLCDDTNTPIHTEENITSESERVFSPISPHISSSCIMFYHSSEGRNRSFLSRPAPTYPVSIFIRRDAITGVITVIAKRRKPRPRSRSNGTNRDHGPSNIDTLNIEADGVIPSPAENELHTSNTRISSVNLANEISETTFEPVLSIPKLDISQYRPPARCKLTSSTYDTPSSQPECYDVESSSIIEINEGGDGDLSSLLDVKVVSNQPKQSRIDPYTNVPPSSPSGNNGAQSTSDIQIVLTEIPDTPSSPQLPTIELSDSSDIVDSPCQDVTHTQPRATAYTDGDAANGISDAELENAVKSLEGDNSAHVMKELESGMNESHKNTAQVESEKSRTRTRVKPGNRRVKKISSPKNSRVGKSNSKGAREAFPDSEYIQHVNVNPEPDKQTDDGSCHIGDDEGAAMIPSPSPENIIQCPGDENNSINNPKQALICDDDEIPPADQSDGSDEAPTDSVLIHSEDFHHGDRTDEDGETLLMSRSLLSHSFSKKLKKKSRFLTSKQKLKLSASRGDKLLRKQSSKWRAAATRLNLSNKDVTPEHLERIPRMKCKREKYKHRFQAKSMVRIQPEKKRPSLRIAVVKPIRNNMFETRGRSTSPESEGAKKKEKKYHRNISRIPKRFNKTLSTFYPALKTEEGAERQIKPIPRHHMNYPRPEPGVRLSLKDTVVYARQERRTFSCFECTSCFETPYQLLQHSMLQSCDQFNSRWPEY